MRQKVPIALLMIAGSRGRALIPTRLQSVAELIYGFIYKMVEDVVGHDGVKYFPYVMTLFLFVLFSNLLGLIPQATAFKTSLRKAGDTKIDILRRVGTA